MGRLVSCSSCLLHIMPHETRCPHCGTEQRSTSAPVASSVLLGLALTACPASDDGDTGAGTESASTTAPTSSTDPSSTTQTSNTGMTTSSTTDDSLSGSGGVEYGSADTFDVSTDPSTDTDATSGSTGDTGTSSGSTGTGDTTAGTTSDSAGEAEYGVPESEG